MSFGLGINGALGGAAQGATIGSAIPGIGTAAGGIIGGGLGLLGGLFGGGNSAKQQKELMDKAWEYEKEGMGMQYQYGQMAADEAQRRNLEMWNSTNFEQLRETPTAIFFTGTVSPERYEHIKEKYGLKTDNEIITIRTGNQKGGHIKIKVKELIAL